MIVAGLDNNCSFTLLADQILEGGPYGPNSAYTVEIDKTPGAPDCNGPWLSNTLGFNDINQTYCVRVTDPVTGNFCVGFLHIVDNIAPTVSCINNKVKNTDPGQCNYTAVTTEFDATTSGDNCSTTTLSYTLTGVTTGTGATTLANVDFQKGLTTVKWKATDSSGNPATCTFTVQVNDNEPPTIVCPANLTLNADPGVCTYTVTGAEFDPLSWGDNCPGATNSWDITGATTLNDNTPLAGVVMQAGLSTVSWLATAADGITTATCSFTVLVNGSQPPAVVCPGNQGRNTDLSFCTYTAAGTEFDLVSITGNNCSGAPTISYTLTGATTGNGATTLAGQVFLKGQTTVTWTVASGNGAPVSCSFLVNVTDAQAPAITCPGNQNRNTKLNQCHYSALGAEFDPSAFSDNCTGPSLAYILSGATSGSGTSSLGGTAFQKGLTTITWTITDAANTSASCSFTVLVTDGQAPTITCPGSQNRNTNTGVCTYTAAGTEFNPGFFGDNCPGASIAYVLSGTTSGNGTTTLSGKVFSAGLTTVTWTVTDAVNLSASCSFNVIVNDGQAPAITCPGNQTRSTSLNLCSYTALAAEFDPTAFSDNCSGVVGIAYALSGATTGTGGTTLAGQVFQKGQTTVSWTATDAAGNPATCSFVVTINDLQAPTIACPGSQTRSTNPNLCSYTALGTEFNPIAFSDNCPGVTIAYVLSGATTGSGTATLAGKVFLKGQTTVNWTATDAAGNPATCSFVVTVNDVQPPSITCPGSQSRNTNASICTYTAVGTEFDPTSFGDNCPGTSLSYALSGATTGTGTTTLAGKVFQKGLTTIAWTVTDAANQSVSCTFNVTVTDGQIPTIICPGNQTRNTNLNQCSYTAVGAEFNPVAFGDNCSGAGITYSLTGATTGAGSTTLAGIVFQKGLTVVNWTVTDGANLTAVCVFSVTVNDGQAISIVCPGNQTRPANAGQCTYTAVGTEFNLISVSADNCPGAPAITYNLTGATTGSGVTTLAGKVFLNGQTTVTWTATDVAGNPATCSFVLTVNDLQAPMLSCPGHQIRNTNPNQCTYAVATTEFNPGTFIDNCPGAALAYVLTGATTGNGSTLLLNLVLNKGLTTVTWTATDASNNTTSCSFTVDIKDVQAPALVCAFNQVRNTNTGLCTYTAVGAEFNPLAFTDNCPGASIAYVLTGVTTGNGTATLAGKVFNKGLTTVTWTATDLAGNTVTCTFTVDVKDMQGPPITCPFNQSRNTNIALCSYTTISGEFNASVSPDNCGGLVTIAYSLTGATTGNGPTTLAGKVFQKGLTTVRWTATDAISNTASCTFTVNVKDIQPPVFNNCTPTLYNIPMTPACTVTMPDYALLLVATDNCPGVTKTQVPAAGTVLNVVHNQTVTVVVTAKDASNNTNATACTRTIIVKDQTKPTITTCPPNRIVTLSPDCKITIPDMRAELVATDCSLPLTVTQVPAQGTVLPSDAYDAFPVTMSVKDVAGNVQTCVVTVTAEFRYFAYIPTDNPRLVATVNTNSNTIIAYLPIPSLLSFFGVSVSPDGSRAYVTRNYSPFNDNLFVINTVSNTQIAIVHTSLRSRGVCVSADGSRVYVANIISSGIGNVSVVNANNNTLITNINISGEPYGICMSPNLNMVYVTDGGNNIGKIRVVNTTSNSLQSTITGLGINPYGICVSPNGTKLYVCGHFNNNHKVVVVDAINYNIIASITVGSEPKGICITPNGNYVYVSNNNSDNVSVINTATNQVDATITLDLGAHPFGISVTPDGARVYVANNGLNKMSVISTTTNSIVATVPNLDKPLAFGNFIGGPLCLFGNNAVEPSDERASESEFVPPATGSEFQVLPNPFTDELSVVFHLEETTRTQLVLLDMTGRVVLSETEKTLEAGPQSLRWNTENLPQGAYLVGLKTDGAGWKYQKVMLLR